MDLPAVIAVLNDVPDTFRRNVPPYTQFIDSAATLLARYTEGSDAILTQIMMYGPDVVDGWLDTWGLLWGVPRPPNESNALYRQRIQEVILAWVGTVPAIQRWIDLFAPGATVIENSPLGYTITFPPAMTAMQIQDFLISFNRIRPAGMPFNAQQSGFALVLDTDAFMGIGSRVAGDYLAGGLQPIVLPFGAVTNSAKQLLPTYLLDDPVLGQRVPPQAPGALPT